MKILSNKKYKELCDAVEMSKRLRETDQKTIKNLLDHNMKKAVEIDNLSKDAAHWRAKYEELLSQFQKLGGSISRWEEAQLKATAADAMAGCKKAADAFLANLPNKNEPTLPFRPHPKPTKLWLTPTEVAAQVGLHQKSVRKWARKWKVRYKMLERKVWYSTADVYKALEMYQRNKKRYVGAEA